MFMRGAATAVGPLPLAASAGADAVAIGPDRARAAVEVGRTAPIPFGQTPESGFVTRIVRPKRALAGTAIAVLAARMSPRPAAATEPAASGVLARQIPAAGLVWAAWMPQAARAEIP